MLSYKVECNGKPVILSIGVAVKTPSKVCIRVFNPDKKNTVYTDRWQTVEGEADFEVRMPQNCKEVIAQIWLKNSESQDNIRITHFKLLPIKQYAPCVDGGKRIREFVKFAQFFCENCGSLPTGSYYSDDDQFRIDYVPTILGKDGNEHTPARISNVNGRIEISRKAFINCTVPMRMVILLHEYSHFNMNDIQKDEIEADLNALKVYLGMGYPIIEAHKGFLRVFQQYPSEENKERYQYIKTFIDHFEDVKYSLCIP